MGGRKSWEPFSHNHHHSVSATEKAHEQRVTPVFNHRGRAVLNQRIEVKAVHRSGHEFPIELAIQAIHGKGTVHFSAFVRDITDR